MKYIYIGIIISCMSVSSVANAQAFEPPAQAPGNQSNVSSHSANRSKNGQVSFHHTQRLGVAIGIAKAQFGSVVSLKTIGGIYEYTFNWLSIGGQVNWGIYRQGASALRYRRYGGRLLIHGQGFINLPDKFDVFVGGAAFLHSILILDDFYIYPEVSEAKTMFLFGGQMQVTNKVSLRAEFETGEISFFQIGVTSLLN